MLIHSLIICLVVLFVSPLMGQQEQKPVSPDLMDSENLVLLNVLTESIEKDGKDGIKVIRSHPDVQDETMVIFPNIPFHNGIIEVELSGEPLAEEDPNMRGFVGIAFRINPDDHYNYECIYLRPTNGRAPQQVRRNHSTQYISHPDYPWYRQREESPGVYESYVDLVPGQWTSVKIEVNGTEAKLYVHGAEQPCLVISDLKKGDREGLIGLWLHATTLAYYRNLKITFTP